MSRLRIQQLLGRKCQVYVPGPTAFSPASQQLHVFQSHRILREKRKSTDAVASSEAIFDLEKEGLLWGMALQSTSKTFSHPRLGEPALFNFPSPVWPGKVLGVIKLYCHLLMY
jgi:hypothetical protein